MVILPGRFASLQPCTSPSKNHNSYLLVHCSFHKSILKGDEFFFGVVFRLFLFRVDMTDVAKKKGASIPALVPNNFQRNEDESQFGDISHPPKFNSLSLKNDGWKTTFLMITLQGKVLNFFWW